jgi:cell division protein FtsB
MKQLLTFLLLVALGAGLYYFLVVKPVDQPVNPNANNSGFLKTEAEIRNKLAEFRIEQDKVRRRIALLEDGKNKTVAYLKENGITSTSDITDKEVKLKVNSLKRDVADIKKLKDSVAEYDKAIYSIESMLEEIARNRITEEVAISDDKALEMDKIIIHLDEKLGVDEEIDILEEEELRDLLESELGESEPSNEAEAAATNN